MVQIKKKSKDEVLPQLDSMSKKLEEHYGKKPVFYATMTAYYEYLKGEVDGDRLWIRSVYSNPKYLGVGDWKFWQFTDSAKLDGYDGKEDYIDVNIFNGTLDELDNY